MKLRGRVAVVTGAAGGLGRALALELAHAGMDLALADIAEGALEHTAAELRATGRRVLSVPTDVSDPRALERLLARTLTQLGSCHLMCNNAGVFHAAPMLEASEAEWSRVIGVNLWGVVHGSRIFGAHFAAQGEGHLLNTASAAGLFPVPGMSAYSTSKYAVVGFSQQLRWELAPDGVGVTVLCPGVIKTQMARAAGVGLEHVDVDAMIRYAPSAERLAKQALRAITRNSPMVLYGPEAHAFRLLRLLPAWLVDPFGRYMAREGLKTVRLPRPPG
jgi:short-subunit dehydrogenase